MPLAKHDQVVKQLAAQCAHPSFRVSVLPRRARRDADLPDAQVVDARVEFAAEDGIAIWDQPQRHDVRTDGLQDLLRGPRGVRVCRPVDVTHTAAFKREDKKDVEKVCGGRSSMSAMGAGAVAGVASACISRPRPCPRRGQAS